MNWLVLFVMGGKEQKICNLLNQNEELHAFTPLKEVVYKKQGVQSILKKPLFTSYVFVETNLGFREFHEILRINKDKINGIIKELKYEDEITALTQDEKDYLCGLMDEEHVVHMSKGEIIDGHVMISEGPLKGYESQIVKIDRHKKRAILNVLINHREMEVNVSLEIIKKIGSKK